MWNGTKKSYAYCENADKNRLKPLTRVKQNVKIYAQYTRSINIDKYCMFNGHKIIRRRRCGAGVRLKNINTVSH